jgi:hypothetical protein
MWWSMWLATSGNGTGKSGGCMSVAMTSRGPFPYSPGPTNVTAKSL